MRNPTEPSIFQFRGAAVAPYRTSRQNLQFGAARGRANFIWSRDSFTPQRFRINLYRFLRDNIPLLSGTVWTWSRLSSGSTHYEAMETSSKKEAEQAEKVLGEMALRIYPFSFQRGAGLESFLPYLFSSLYTDGAFAGFALVSADQSGLERFLPVDVAHIAVSEKSGKLLYHDGDRELRLDHDDFYYLGLSAEGGAGLGKSIMSAVPFVAYIEQQLVEDMHRTTHNAGYHRLHVRVKPPEKMAGETDKAYVDRINAYFDETVSMIKECAPEDNPVTWDNVEIEYIGPGNIRSVGNSWFLNHRAMVEEICAGTNLAPFMLGYSYGTTHNWAQFKYDLVMRQVHSVQRQAARFLEWLGNIELGLRGFNCRCRFIFDNSFTFLSAEKQEINKSRAENLIRFYQAGLISKERAEKEMEGLL